MKKLFFALALCTLSMHAIKKEHGTELQVIPERGLEFEDETTEILLAPEPAQPAPQEKKSRTSGWHVAKKILITSLLASQALGLATDIVGMQESQAVSNLASPVVAYNIQDYWNQTHSSNCSATQEAGYLYPLPLFVRDVSCKCGPDENCGECAIEICPGGDEYIKTFSIMYTSQLASIATRTATIFALVASTCSSKIISYFSK